MLQNQHFVRRNTNDYSRPSTFSDIVSTFIYFFVVGKTKESVIDAETESILVSSFIIIYSVVAATFVYVAVPD